jgi:predicted aspartyl protease
MGVIINRVKLAGSKGGKKIDALYDSGASFFFINKKLAEELGNIDKLPNPIEFETAKEGDKVQVKERVVLDFYIEGIRLSDEFMIGESLSEDLIIGVSTMQKWRLKLDFEQDRVIVDQRVTRLMLK